MKKLNFMIILVLVVFCTLQPVKALEIFEEDDELGRPFIGFFGSDSRVMTMFYDDIPNLFLRRERNAITEELTIRESASFPIVSEKDFHKNYTYEDLLTGIRHPIEIPTNGFFIGSYYAMTVNLRNTFMAFTEISKMPDAEIETMYYDVIVRRLHDDEENALFKKAREKIEAAGFSMIRPEIMKIEPGILFEEVYLSEINENGKVPFKTLFDPIEINLLDESGPGVVAINIEKDPGEIYKIPLIYEHNLTKIVIAEAGTYIVVEDNFEAEYINYDTMLAGLDDYRKIVDILNRAENEPELPPEDDNPSDPENSGNLLIWILIPCAILAAAALIILIKNKQNKSKARAKKRKKKKR
ncbi:MAG: hypothetical protein FWD44_04670 [Oscillospiraceae bacterium]|nr:hypothetical protein [Oscillospiraceae bacterium]